MPKPAQGLKSGGEQTPRIRRRPGAPPSLKAIEPRKPLTREEAEAVVRGYEAQLEALLSPYHPAHFAGEIALRVRQMEKRPALMATTPPHQLIHAVEANCAYWQPFSNRVLTGTGLDTLGKFMNSFDDPAMLHAVGADSDLFEFVCYMYRTQMENQGKLWNVPVGRPILMLGDPKAMPATAARFAARFGVSPREWLQAAFVFYSATALDPVRIGFDQGYVDQLSCAGFSKAAAEGFLSEVSRTPQELGVLYREGRQAYAPLTWIQRRPSLQRYPIMRFHDGKFGVPVPSLLLHLFADGLSNRISELEDESVTAELSKRFEWYCREIWSQHLPKLPLWDQSMLAVQEEGAHCDLAVELHDALLLIECKAVTEDRNLVTRKAMLESGAVPKIIKGYGQLLQTAQRIRAGGYPTIRIAADKPIVGIVVTLGYVPAANHEAVLATAAPTFASNGFTPARLAELLKFPPQTFGIEALEYLVMLLRAGGSLLPLFEEKCGLPTWQIGDWPTFLNKKASGGRKHDLTWWRDALDGLAADLGVDLAKDRQTRPRSRWEQRRAE